MAAKLATCLLHRRYAFLHGTRQRLIRGVIDALVECAPPDLLVHRFIRSSCVRQHVRATQEQAGRAKKGGGSGGVHYWM